MLATYWEGGSGGHGRLELYRLGAELSRLWRSPSYWQYSVRVLDPGWVLVFYRPEGAWEEPHALYANCCLPVDGQVLWKREGDRFVKAGERLIPNPYRAVSLFVGALKKGDIALARRWATSGQVVEAAAKVIGEIDPGQWPGGQGGVWEGEAMHWDAIPAPLRGPEPSVTRVTWPSGKYTLVTTRQSGQWKVSGVETGGGK